MGSLNNECCKLAQLGVFLLGCSWPFAQAEANCPYTSVITTPGNYTLNVAKLFAPNRPINSADIAQAVACAKTMLGNQIGGNGVTVTVQLPAGIIDLSDVKAPATAAIDLSGINCPNPSIAHCGARPNQPITSNQFILRGYGGNNTTLILPLHEDHSLDVMGIQAFNVTNIKIEKLGITYKNQTVTQGRVLSANLEQVVLELEPGFANPASMTDLVMFPDQGRYMRRYRYAFNAERGIHYCRIIPDAVKDGIVEWSQVPWGKPGLPNLGIIVDPANPRIVTIPFTSTRREVPYSPGDIVGIKAKQGRDVYRFSNSAFTTLDSVLFKKKSRGMFAMANRGGVPIGPLHVTVNNSRIIREAPIGGIEPCLSTPDGGPQIGFPGAPGEGHVITNNFIQGSGDDSVALFDAANSYVGNNRIYDSFGRSVLFVFTAYNKSMATNNLDMCSSPNTFLRNDAFEWYDVDARATYKIINCPNQAQ